MTIMKHSERLEIFERLQEEYSSLLTAILWKLTGDRELFAEAMQYAQMFMWRNVEKLSGKGAAGYIYKIALSANSRAWRNRIGNNGHFHPQQGNLHNQPDDNIYRTELVKKLKKAISRLPAKQSTAIVMRYLEQYDYDTIAGKLGCSSAGARSHVSKALATLKIKLAFVRKIEVEK